MARERMTWAIASALLGVFLATVLYAVFLHEDDGVAVMAQILALVLLGAVAIKVAPASHRMDGIVAAVIGFYAALGVGYAIRVAFGHGH